MKAKDFLDKAISTLAERGGKYESNGEENSMLEIVNLHADLTPGAGGLGNISELEGWYFMLALKLVRLRKSIEQGKASKDSIVDLLGYTAKMGECLFADDEEEYQNRCCTEPEESPSDFATAFPPLDPSLGDATVASELLTDESDEVTDGPLLTERDCLHISCTMKDIEDRLVIVCDDCPKQFTAKEFVDNECEAR